MKANIKIKLGDKVLEIAGEGTEAIIVKALAFWSQLPTICGKCKSTNIGLNYKSPKGNDYYGLKCNACSAEFNFHQKKEGGFYLTKDDVWDIWQKQPDTNSQFDKTPPPNGDIPF